MTTATETKNVTEVRQASDEFYSALNAMLSGDIGPMESIWSHSQEATLMGPFGERWIGWEQVRAEFKQDAQMHIGGTVTPRDVLVRADGDLGYTICMETGENITMQGHPVVISHRATNIFRRESGQWKMIHHHTDEAPDLQEAVGRGTI